MFGKLFRKSPADYMLRITPADIDVRIAASETLLQGALKQGIAFPHNCRAGGCGECKCRLLEGKVKELTDKSYLLSAEELRDNYILACQSIPKSDVVISVELRQGPAHPLVECQGSIASMDLLTQDILRLVLDLDATIAYTPGQYAQLSLRANDGGELISRNYSFASCPDDSGTSRRVEFFIRKVTGGRFTEALFGQASVGMTLGLQGPYGDFYLRQAPAPVLCIAGGSGLAPLMAILKAELGKATKPRDLTLIFGARTQQDLYLLNMLEQFGKQWLGRFDFIPILSSEPAAGEWLGRRGLIPDHIVALLGDRLSQCHAYLCGPPPMIDACIELLVTQGIDQSVVYADKFLDQSHLNRPSD
ncbi:MAG: 2Fe-2S iron-sulfur cluster binding domain-containing protein [Sterolibacterium sp.]